MPRKILIVLSVIVVILIVITGALFFISKTTPKPDESGVITKIRDLFPFGKTTTDPDMLFNGENTDTNENATTTNNLSNETIPRLRHIYTKPTSGSKIWSEIDPKTKEKKYFIRFVERATGHVSETTPDSVEIKKISNTTIPKVYEAKFATEKTILDRFLSENNETIKTYFVNIKDKLIKTATTSASSTNNIVVTTKESVGNYLEEEIKEISISPSKNKVVYSIYDGASGGKIILSNIDGTSKKQIFSSPIRDWLLEWQNDQTVIITTKPSGFSEGYVYSLNVNSGSISKIVGGIFGVTILPKPTTNDLLMGSGGGSLSLSLLKKQSGNNTFRFLAKTLPEKCTWSKKDTNLVYCAVPGNIPNGAYPDDWYQGGISFSDSLWRINTTTGQTNIILTPQIAVGETIDMTNLDISDDDSYITFIDKNDLSLWGYQLILPVKKVTTPTATSTPTNTATTTR